MVVIPRMDTRRYLPLRLISVMPLQRHNDQFVAVQLFVDGVELHLARRLEGRGNGQVLSGAARPVVISDRRLAQVLLQYLANRPFEGLGLRTHDLEWVG